MRGGVGLDTALSALAELSLHMPSSRARGGLVGRRGREKRGGGAEAGV